jgi:hypothetical protein
MNNTEANRLPQCLLEWTALSLMGSIVLTFSSLLAFFYDTMRYLADFMPSLILLSALGFWQGLQYLKMRESKFRSPYGFSAILLAAPSCIISILLAINSPANIFAKYNPALLKAMANLFGR